MIQDISISVLDKEHASQVKSVRYGETANINSTYIKPGLIKLARWSKSWHIVHFSPLNLLCCSAHVKLSFA